MGTLFSGGLPFSPCTRSSLGPPAGTRIALALGSLLGPVRGVFTEDNCLLPKKLICRNTFYVCACVCVHREECLGPKCVAPGGVTANTAVRSESRGSPCPDQGRAHWAPCSGNPCCVASLGDMFPSGAFRGFPMSCEHCLYERSCRCFGTFHGHVGCRVQVWELWAVGCLELGFSGVPATPSQRGTWAWRAFSASRGPRPAGVDGVPLGFLWCLPDVCCCRSPFCRFFPAFRSALAKHVFGF